MGVKGILLHELGIEIRQTPADVNAHRKPTKPPNFKSIMIRFPQNPILPQTKYVKSTSTSHISSPPP